MAIRKERGVRRVELEYEVPGTPEEVWRAIATGPGITSWFTPTELEEREGGRVVFHLSAETDAPATVTAWEPPRRLAYEERNWAGDAPPLGSEFIVEAQRGGSCIVRIVHTLFTDSSAWDDQLESFEGGWTPCFDVLRLVLRHFQGRPCAAVRVMAPASATREEAWRGMTSALGMAEVRPGAHADTSRSSAPPLSGVAELVRRGAEDDVVLLLERPVPGVAVFGIYQWSDQLMASASLHLFGSDADAIAARDRDAWGAWIRNPARAHAGAAPPG